MKFVLTGGGTAGHINPALALAEELQARGHEVLYAGTPQGVEARLVPAAGLPFVPFEAAGFDRARPLSLISAVAKLAKSRSKAKSWLAQVRPDAVVGFGGYVSIPVGSAAAACGIPLVIHEQNSVMGVANRELAKSAHKVCLTYACSAGSIAPEKVSVTGNPVRRSVLDARREDGRAFLNIPHDALMLLVFGGSLGARHINTSIAAMKDELLAREGLYVVHITGPKELETVEQQLALTPEEQKRYMVFGYQDRMGETMAAADAIVSRAGATSLAEISARAIPALLIPFPYATADHQTTNAQAYVNEGCAYMLKDDQVETDEFKRLVGSLVDDVSVREKMHAKALAQEATRATARLADIVESSVAR